MNLIFPSWHWQKLFSQKQRGREGRSGRERELASERACAQEFFVLVLVFIFSWEECHMHLNQVSESGAPPRAVYMSHGEGVAVNKLTQTRSTSSAFCPSSWACYWLIHLGEECLLTQTLSKFLKKISALKGNRGSSSGSKKSLIFHL